MTKKSTETHTLLDEQLALRVYLDALLCEIDIDDDVVSANTNVGVELAADDHFLMVPGEADSHQHETLDTDTLKVVSEQKADDSAAPGLSEWAENEFQCLSFQVAGLTLAAPLGKLNGIVELNEDLTALPGYSPWMLGILNNRGQNVQVIDISQIVMPKNRRPSSSVTGNNHSKYVVLINSGNFGLAADSLSQVLTLSKNDVRWRGANGKRPWLAGTVIEQMCAILDIDRLIEELNTGIQVKGRE